MHSRKYIEAIRYIDTILESPTSNSSSLLFLKSLCLNKISRFSQSLEILSILRRNQLSKKVKVRALLLRMKTYWALANYENAFRDA